MPATSTGSPSKSLTADEAAAVLMLRSGASREHAASETGLTLKQVDSAFSRAGEHRSSRPVPAGLAAPRAVPAGQQQPFLAPAAAAAPAVPAAPLTPTPRPPAAEQKKADSTEALLRWAEESELPRANRLAERARAALAELRALENRGSAISAARDRVAELERQLQAAKSALRAASSTKPITAATGPAPSSTAAASAAGRREELAAIREWARANAHQVPDRGRIPGWIVDLWRDATSSGSDES